MIGEADAHAGFGRFMRYAVPVTTVIAIAVEVILDGLLGRVNP